MTDNHDAASSAPPGTLAIDIGGSGLKATVLDADGKMLVERVRIPTPRAITPDRLVETLAGLVEPLPAYDRVSVGFPGVVHAGVIRTAPNLGTTRFRGFDLARGLKHRLGKPVRVINDADMQGYGAIRGKGIEMVITLGTGFGSALFSDGRLAPHLELAHHPFEKGETYEQRLGDAELKRVGERKWSRRVRRAIDQLRALANFDHLFVGGGNAHKLKVRLPKDASIVDNNAGLQGGIRLWEDASHATDA